MTTALRSGFMPGASGIVVAGLLLVCGRAHADDPEPDAPGSTLEVTFGLGGGSLPTISNDPYYQDHSRGDDQYMRAAALDVRFLFHGPHGIALRLESDDDKRPGVFVDSPPAENRILAYDAAYVYAAVMPPSGTSGLLVELRTGAGGTHLSRHELSSLLVHAMTGCSVGWDFGTFMIDADFALRWGLDGETEALDAGNVYLLRIGYRD
jgi:hypothetical protein